MKKPDPRPEVKALIREIQRYLALVEALRADDADRPPRDRGEKPSRPS